MLESPAPSNAAMDRAERVEAERDAMRRVVNAAKVLRLHPRHKPGCASCAEVDAAFDAALAALEKP